MGQIEDIINAAKPEGGYTDEVLEALYDALDKGGTVPNDDTLVTRLTLAGVRRVDRRSMRSEHRIDMLWFAFLCLSVAIAAVALILYTHTNGLHDVFPDVLGTAGITGIAVSGFRLLANHVH